MGIKLTPVLTVVGGIVGGIAGSIIPGAGTAAGAMMGAALGATVGGAMDASKASKEAANVQAQAAQQANTLLTQTQARIELLQREGKTEAAEQLKLSMEQQLSAIRNEAAYQIGLIQKTYEDSIAKYAEESGVSVETLKKGIDIQLETLNSAELENLSTLKTQYEQAGRTTTEAVQEAYNQLVSGRKDAEASYAAGAAKALEAMEFSYDAEMANTINGFNEAKKRIDDTVNVSQAYAKEQGGIAKSAILSGKNQMAKILNNANAIGDKQLEGALQAATTAITEGTKRGLEVLEPYISAGKSGIEAFREAALNPNNALFVRNLNEAQTSLQKNLIAKGITGGAAASLMSKQAERMALEEQDKQVERQRALALMGIDTAGQAAGLRTAEGQNIASLQQQTGAAKAQLVATIAAQIAAGEQTAATQLSDVTLQVANLVNQYGLEGASQITGLDVSKIQELNNIVGNMGSFKAQLEQQKGSFNAANDLDTANKMADLKINEGNILANLQSSYGTDVANLRANTAGQKVGVIGSGYGAISEEQANLARQNFAAAMGNLAAKTGASSTANQQYLATVGGFGANMANLATGTASSITNALAGTTGAQVNVGANLANARAANEMNQANIQSQAVQNLINTGASLYMADQQNQAIKSLKTPETTPATTPTTTTPTTTPAGREKPTIPVAGTMSSGNFVNTPDGRIIPKLNEVTGGLNQVPASNFRSAIGNSVGNATNVPVSRNLNVEILPNQPNSNYTPGFIPTADNWGQAGAGMMSTNPSNIQSFRTAMVPAINTGFQRASKLRGK